MAFEFWYGVNLLPPSLLTIYFAAQLFDFILELRELLVRHRRGPFGNLIHLGLDGPHPGFQIVPPHSPADDDAQATNDETRVGANPAPEWRNPLERACGGMIVVIHSINSARS